ncbi:MAG: peptidoglycan DD-metalloendopeptidase family protein, partial [Alphaproteobacteria bacterium]|nr:peptidoglycan DD-metalloendopeptidase family protein [Alphaproteobacteria bacterium]
MRFLLLFLVGFSIVCTPVLAQSKTQEKLKAVQRKLKSEKQKQKQIETEKAKVRATIDQFKTKSVSLAKDLQEKENVFQELSEKVSTLKMSEEKLNSEIKKEKKDITALLEILQRIALEPPALVLMEKQTKGMEMMNTALLVEGTVEIAQGKITAYLEKQEELKRLKKETEEKSREAEKMAHTVKAKKQEMDSLLSEKQRAEKKLEKEQNATRKKIQKLAKESKDLSDFLKKLMEKKKTVLGTAPSSKAKTNGPVRGKTITRFGAKKSGGLKEKGITLKAGAKASVVSPYNGRILFSGPFKKYDNLMIIAHPNNYHSVIGGITTPFVKEGQSVLKGEPIGRLGSDGKIYIELRYKN